MVDESLWELAVADIRIDQLAAADLAGADLFEATGAVAVLNVPSIIAWIYSPEVDLPVVLKGIRTSNPVPPLNVTDELRDAEGVIEAAGWRLDEVVTQMVLRSRDALIPTGLPPGYTIEAVEIPDGIPEFHASMASGFEDNRVEQWLPADAIVNFGLTLFLARDADGRPVGTAGARRRVRGGQLFAISVPPGQRGRGIGSALTATAAEAMFDQGADFVQLQATHYGHRVYERAGFVAAGAWRCYSPV